MRRLLPTIAASAVLFSCALASAQSADDPEVRQIFGEAGFGSIDEDHFATFRLGFHYFTRVKRLGCESGEDDCQTRFRATLQAPLRLRVLDAPPENDGLVRTQDWDEPSDFLRIARFVEYGRPYEAVHGRFGELGAVVLGHGTIMNGYLNVVTPDVYQGGVHANLNTAYGGLQIVLDDVLDPKIFAARGFVRPSGWFEHAPFFERMALGVSTATDLEAPLELERTAGGDVAVGPRQLPVLAESRPFTMAGIDLELALLDNETVALLSYVDFNYGLGPGLHTGTSTGWQISDDVRLSARGEFRVVGPRYLPDHFGPIYEVGRFQYGGWEPSLPAPKLRVAASREETVLGGYGSLAGGFRDWFNLSLALADYEGGRNTSAWARLDVKPPGPLVLGLFYFKQNMDQLEQVTSLDGALVAAEARIAIWGPVYLLGDYERLWRLHSDGRFETVDAWNAGLGAAHRF